MSRCRFALLVCLSCLFVFGAPEQEVLASSYSILSDNSGHTLHRFDEHKSENTVSRPFDEFIDTVLVYSEAMNKAVPNVVIIPENYHRSARAFPTLYLLHGAGGDYLNWLRNVPHITRLASKHQMIIICPDGGNTSWYFDSPIDPGMQYETYLAEELVSFVDSTYRTIQHPSGRGVTGLSMGGHGSLYLALRNQDIWGAAGSMSGGLDLRPYGGHWNIAERLGAKADFPERWEQHSVINMLHQLEGSSLEIMIDCGKSDFFYEANLAVHRKLERMNYPHRYIEGPGHHNWQYWARAIHPQAQFFQEYFQRSRVTTGVPAFVDPNTVYLFYLHGGVVQDQGADAVSQYYGAYKYHDILDTLSGRGMHVISEVRPKDTDERIYAAKIARQVDTLLNLGVTPENIVIAGASLGAYIAVEAAYRLQNPNINVALLGLCTDYSLDYFQSYRDKLCGRWLSISEQSDPKGPCTRLLDNPDCKSGYRELELETGYDHGFLFRPYRAWVDPLVQWINEH